MLQVYMRCRTANYYSDGKPAAVACFKLEPRELVIILYTFSLDVLFQLLAIAVS